MGQPRMNGNRPVGWPRLAVTSMALRMAVSGLIGTNNRRSGDASEIAGECPENVSVGHAGDVDGIQ